MNLTINKTGIFGRWYLWSEGICTEFSDKEMPDGHTNLCRVFWALIGAPFVLLWQVAAILGAVAVIGPLPAWLFGWERVLGVYLGSVMFVLLFSTTISVIVGIVWFWKGSSPGGKLAIAVYHGIKDRFCPLVKLEG